MVPTLRGAGFLMLSLVATAASAGPANFSVVYNTSGGFSHYFWSIGIDGAAASANPTLYVSWGRTYSFLISTAGGAHPFWIDESTGIGGTNPYPVGVDPTTLEGLSANNIQASSPASVTFRPRSDAPETLHYSCAMHPEMNGVIQVVVFRAGFDN